MVIVAWAMSGIIGWHMNSFADGEPPNDKLGG